jgi:flagellar hook-associated protein 1 FlgK
MGLTTSLSNAVTGLRTNQDALDILSRNIANSGTPGYHRQSLNVIDHNTQSSTYARTAGATRAFNQSLQTYYTRQVADTAYSGVQASYLDRLQGFLGKPGSASSLDTQFGNLQTALQELATSPDNYTTRASALASAQNMVETLNRLSTTVQGMRQETEGQIAANVNNLNGMLNSLGEVNNRMLDLGMTDTSRAALQDQRDRLVSSVAEIIDVQASYRADGTVSLMTRAGVGLIEHGVATVEFESAGNLSPNSLIDADPEASKVGRLTLITPAGLTIDLVTQGVLQGGELGGLIQLRDKTLVEAQEQLDEIAAGLAQAFSTNQRPGTAQTIGGASGFDLDVSGLQPGNDIVFRYSEGNVEHRVRVVNSAQGQDYKDASGQRVIGIDFSGLSSADAAQALDDKLQGLAISSTGTGNLRILDDGTGRTEVNAAAVRVTAGGVQGDGMGLNLFVDQGNSAFTNDLDGPPPQKQGFAVRIALNSAVVADNRLLVQHKAGGSLGESDRPDYLIEQLQTLGFVSGGKAGASGEKFQLSGTLGEMITQVVGYQGASIGAAISKRDDRQMTLDTVVDQMQSEYGVNVDEEMARLMELQNAYAANARVVSVVKELLDALFAST